MAHFQNHYAAVPPTEEYGNPVYQSSTNTGDYGLQRSGSSCSSSSSEDDGHGGRRKKGLKEKKKEKLGAVGQKDKGNHVPATTTPGGYNMSGAGQHHQHKKKGMMDKIKDKLPGHHHH